jgi:hypothetical protein
MKRDYAFLTSGSRLIEVKATNPQQAYGKAKKKLQKFKRIYKKEKWDRDLGHITTSYTTFGRYGFAPTGIYKQVKLKKVI